MERPSNTTLALLGGVAALIILIAWFAATRNADQDKLGDAASISAAAAGDPDLGKACSGQLVYEQIKRALFRQAAQVRGSDQDAYEKISTAASVRMENDVAEGQEQGIIDCSGSLSIDLPPGVTTLAGRHMLMTDIYYGVVAMAQGGSKVVQLRNANALIDTLSTLTLSAQAPSPPPLPAPVALPRGDQAGVTDPLAPIEQPPSAPPPAASALPSFDCAKARTQGERSVCADPALAALDRAMASEYRRALAGSSPDQAAALRQTRDRFLAYRDNCPNPSCVADSYTGRIREIRDIAAGRWQPQR